MKKTPVLALLLALFTPALAIAEEWNGWITDGHCGAQGASAEHAACAKKCLYEGSKLVFYNSGDQKIYSLDNQDLALQNLGHEVTVKGELQGNFIKVVSIELAH